MRLENSKSTPAHKAMNLYIIESVESDALFLEINVTTRIAKSRLPGYEQYRSCCRHKTKPANPKSAGIDIDRFCLRRSTYSLSLSAQSPADAFWTALALTTFDAGPIAGLLAAAFKTLDVKLALDLFAEDILGNDTLARAGLGVADFEAGRCTGW